MDLTRGLLGGIAAGADAYSGILKEESKMAYEDEKSNTLFQRQQSMEALRRKGNMDVAKFQAGQASTLAKEKSGYAMAQDENRMKLASEAKVKEQEAMKKAAQEQMITDINAKVEGGTLDPEIGAFQTEMIEAGVSPSLVMRTPGKALDTGELRELAEAGATLFPEDLDKSKKWVKDMKDKLERGTGGAVTAQKVSDIKYDQAMIQTFKETDGMTKSELIKYKSTREANMKKRGHLDVIEMLNKKIEEAPEAMREGGTGIDAGFLTAPLENMYGRGLNTGA